jgi:hypothetical protein
VTAEARAAPVGERPARIKEGGMNLVKTTTGRPWIALGLLVLLAAGACTETKSLTVRPGFTAYSVEAEVERKVAQDWDPEWDFMAAGIELAVESDSGVVWFMDFNDVTVEGEDSATADIDYDADGYAVGFGLQSPDCWDEGWSCDWRVRVGYHRMDDAALYDSGGVSYSLEWEYEGLEADASFGASYVMPAGDCLLVAPLAGLLAKVMDGSRDEHRNDESIPGISFHGSSDYEVFTAGVYAGLRLKHREMQDFVARAGYFLGLEELQGFYLSVGMRF